MRMLHRLLLQSALVGGLAALGTPAGATPYEVSLLVDASTNSNSNEVSYTELPQTSVSAGPLTSSSAGNVAGNPLLPFSATASASGTAALGRLAASGTAYGYSFGGGGVTVEASFQDYLTVSPTSPSGPLQFEVVFDPVGFVSTVSATAGGAEVTMSSSVEAANLDIDSAAVLPNENVCTEVTNFVVASPCGGYQAAPSEETGIFTSYAGDQIQLAADITLQLLADGTIYCNPVAVPCFNAVSSTATGDFDADVYVIPLTGGASLESTPEPSSLILLATALAALLGFADWRRRRSGSPRHAAQTAVRSPTAAMKGP